MTKEGKTKDRAGATDRHYRLTKAIGLLSLALEASLGGFRDRDAEVAEPVRWAMAELEGMRIGGRA